MAHLRTNYPTTARHIAERLLELIKANETQHGFHDFFYILSENGHVEETFLTERDILEKGIEIVPNLRAIVSEIRVKPDPHSTQRIYFQAYRRKPEELAQVQQINEQEYGITLNRKGTLPYSISFETFANYINLTLNGDSPETILRLNAAISRSETSNLEKIIRR